MSRPAGARKPSLRVERTLQRQGHRVLAGMDEVGRGALAGPVTVGVVVAAEVAGIEGMALGRRLPQPPLAAALPGVADQADLTCSSVAAASVLAKVSRDTLMVAHSAEHPAYEWTDNKGYAAPEHLSALRTFGPTDLHRRSWRLPGVMQDAGMTATPDRERAEG